MPTSESIKAPDFNAPEGGKDPCTEKAPPKIERPVMRNLLQAEIKRNITRAFAAVFVVGLAFKIFYVEAKKRNYRNYYAQLNAEDEYHRMRNLGLMQSAEPDD